MSTQVAMTVAPHPDQVPIMVADSPLLQGKWAQPVSRISRSTSAGSSTGLGSPLAGYSTDSPDRALGGCSGPQEGREVFRMAVTDGGVARLVAAPLPEARTPSTPPGLAAVVGQDIETRGHLALAIAAALARTTTACKTNEDYITPSASTASLVPSPTTSLPPSPIAQDVQPQKQQKQQQQEQRHIRQQKPSGRKAAPTPALGSEAMPSLGSAKHSSGKCKPCVFVHKTGCENGAVCEFCHLCQPGEKLRRQKERRAKRTARLAAKRAAADAVEEPQSGGAEDLAEMTDSAQGGSQEISE
mmetsp:Transcript_34631/g.99806  ORF Transcript_34631/g.99806 Transcript_34631/m.99806 type:complete len:300 (-) Transcript_34631:117-1016(-)